MKTNYANFYFRSLCIKLVALRMNLYQEAALSFKMFGAPASDGVSRLGLGLEMRLETRFLESRSGRSQVSSRSRSISISVSSSSSRDFA